MYAVMCCTYVYLCACVVLQWFLQWSQVFHRVRERCPGCWGHVHDYGFPLVSGSSSGYRHGHIGKYCWYVIIVFPLAIVMVILISTAMCHMIVHWCSSGGRTTEWNKKKTYWLFYSKGQRSEVFFAFGGGECTHF